MPSNGTKWVYSFGRGAAEGRADMKNLLGGQGANLAEMRNLVLEVRPIGGAEVQKLVRDIYASPPEVVQLARELVADAP